MKTKILENTILASLTGNPDWMGIAYDNIRPIMCKDALNKQLFEILFEQYDENGEIDHALLEVEAEKRKLVNYSYFKDIAQFREYSKNAFRSQCEKLREEWEVDQEREILSNALNELDDGKGLSEVVTGIEAEREMYRSIVQGEQTSTFKQISETIDHVLHLHKTGESPGAPLPIQRPDYLRYWKPKDLVIIAARPAMGKTAFALECARHAAQNGWPVGVFSLEMGADRLFIRLQSAESGVPPTKVINNQMTDSEVDRFTKAMHRLFDLNVVIDDDPCTISELRHRARKMVAEKGVRMIIVDYLQLIVNDIVGRNANGEEKLSTISRALKLLAKELNVPVIALSQLSRAVEIRGGVKRPQMSDIRGSGAIEQDADIVAALYRPEYYQILEDEEGRSLKGLTELIVLKHRDGDLGTEKITMDTTHQTFSDWNIEDNYNYHDSTPQPSTQFPVSQPSSIITRPSKKNDDEDIPF
jgi:replicative DNA helicase